MCSLGQVGQMFQTIIDWMKIHVSFGAGNHNFAAIRGTESYSRLQSLAVVLEDMNSLIADPYINVEGRRRLRIVLGGDYKVHVTWLLSYH